MNDAIPNLKIEAITDENGSLIILEQDNQGNSERVGIHLIHLRYMAEKFGVVETYDPQGQKTLGILKRRLNLLFDRIDHLKDRLTNNLDIAHADLSYVRTYATATAEIAFEFCADLEGFSLQGCAIQSQITSCFSKHSSLI